MSVRVAFAFRLAASLALLALVVRLAWTWPREQD